MSTEHTDVDRLYYVADPHSTKCRASKVHGQKLVSCSCSSWASCHPKLWNPVARNTVVKQPIGFAFPVWAVWFLSLIIRLTQISVTYQASWKPRQYLSYVRCTNTWQITQDYTRDNGLDVMDSVKQTFQMFLWRNNITFAFICKSGLRTNIDSIQTNVIQEQFSTFRVLTKGLFVLQQKFCHLLQHYTISHCNATCSLYIHWLMEFTTSMKCTTITFTSVFQHFYIHRGHLANLLV